MIVSEMNINNGDCMTCRPTCKFAEGFCMDRIVRELGLCGLERRFAFTTYERLIVEIIYSINIVNVAF